MKIKRCSKCSQQKPLSYFHRSSDASDGHRPDCKVCRSLNDPRAKSAYYTEHYAKNKEKLLAYRALARAKKNGMRVMPCEVCGLKPKTVKGVQRIEAHHWHGYDFAHRLDVQWLCADVCHPAAHPPASIQPPGRGASDISGQLSSPVPGILPSP